MTIFAKLYLEVRWWEPTFYIYSEDYRRIFFFFEKEITEDLGPINLMEYDNVTKLYIKDNYKSNEEDCGVD